MIKHHFYTVILLFLPLCANALGFGNISVDSFLDQPLRARVELLAENGLQVDEIRASLADADTFRKAGLTRPFALSKLRFKTVAGDDGRTYIEISSRNSIREPYLDFLVEVAWRGATLVKEFTILLDPPVYQPDVAAAAVTKAAPKTAPPQRPQTVAAPAPAPAASYGPVRNSETLWVIAQNTRPDSGYSIEQMMMALQRRNPDAFRRGNVNLLKQGVVLEIPQRSEIAQLSPRAARRAFLQQTREWRAMRSGSQAAPVAAAPSVQPTQRVLREVVDETIEKQGRQANLRVVAPESEWSGDNEPTASESYPAGESERLREAIADSASDLAAVREINRDLEELREALDSKIAALRKSLEERDRTIEMLTRRLDQATAKSEAADAAAGTSATAAPSGPAAGDNGQLPEAGRAPLQIAALLPQAGDGTEVTRWARTYWLPLLVTAGFILLLLTATLLRKRREGAVVPEPDAFDSFLQLDAEPQIAAPKPSKPVKSAAAANFRSFEKREESAPEAVLDVASALTEADVYLAYRRYTQAENLLKEAIKQNPKSMILCAKLLEIYAFRKDKKSFTIFMEEMHETMAVEAPEIWAKIVEMGRDLIPGHPLIAHSVLPEELHLQDFDEQAPMRDTPPQPASHGPDSGTEHDSDKGGLALLQADFDQDGKLKKG